MHPRLKTTRALRQAHSRLCRTLDNFIVRPQRRTVEKFAKPEAWKVLSPESRTEVAHEVAGAADRAGRGARGDQTGVIC
jgi:hypothetical protein